MVVRKAEEGPNEAGRELTVLLMTWVVGFWV